MEEEGGRREEEGGSIEFGGWDAFLGEGGRRGRRDFIILDGKASSL